MRLGELIDERSIDMFLEPTDKESVIEALITRLSEQKLIPEHQNVLDAVLERERALSTGVGQGVAVPHATVEVLDKAIVAFGRSEKGIEFGALDGKPVNLIFLLLAPAKEISLHLKLLSRVSRLCNRPEFRDELLASDNPVGVREVIRKFEAELQEF